MSAPSIVQQKNFRLLNLNLPYFSWILLEAATGC